MCRDYKNGKRHWLKKAIFFPIAVAAGVFIFGNLVMYLWNAILPIVLGVKTITFCQAIGILVLSKILFGGFRGGFRGCRCHGGGGGWRGKWMNMTPEEREKMKEEWKQRCQPSASEKQE